MHWQQYGIEEILPQAETGRDVLLMGCGDAGEKPYLSELGFRPRAFDIRRSSGTDFVSDAHLIGAKDGTFDVVLSMQVLEHLKAPWEAIREVARVLRPGGCFVGSVAFLKPYHSSFFHMSHAAVQVLCDGAGLTVDHLHGAQSLTYTIYGGLMPVGSRRLRRALLAPVDRILLAVRSRAWSLSRKLDADESGDRFGQGIPMSFRQFDRLRVAPVVVFRAWKKDDRADFS